MSVKDMLNGDLHEWGDGKAGVLDGFSALGYPSVTSYDNGYMGHSGRPPVPMYWTNHRIQALNTAIYELNSKIRVILEYHYIKKMGVMEISRACACHRHTVPTRIEKAKTLLIASKFWKP